MCYRSYIFIIIIRHVYTGDFWPILSQDIVTGIDTVHRKILVPHPWNWLNFFQLTPILPERPISRENTHLLLRPATCSASSGSTRVLLYSSLIHSSIPVSRKSAMERRRLLAIKLHTEQSNNQCQQFKINF